MTSPNSPIAVPLLSTGKRRNKTVCMSGIIIPAPDACKIRPTIKNEKLGAMAAVNVPSVNNPIAVRKSFRVVNRSIKNAVTGIIIPLTSINTD